MSIIHTKYRLKTSFIAKFTVSFMSSDNMNKNNSEDFSLRTQRYKEHEEEEKENFYRKNIFKF